MEKAKSLGKITGDQARSRSCDQFIKVRVFLLSGTLNIFKIRNYVLLSILRYPMFCIFFRLTRQCHCQDVTVSLATIKIISSVMW